MEMRKQTSKLSICIIKSENPFKFRDKFLPAKQNRSFKQIRRANIHKRSALAENPSQSCSLGYLAGALFNLLLLPLTAVAAGKAILVICCWRLSFRITSQHWTSICYQKGEKVASLEYFGPLLALQFRLNSEIVQSLV